MEQSYIHALYAYKYFPLVGHTGGHFREGETMHLLTENATVEHSLM